MKKLYLEMREKNEESTQKVSELTSKLNQNPTTTAPATQQIQLAVNLTKYLKNFRSK